MHGRGGHGSRPETTVDPVVMAAAVVATVWLAAVILSRSGEFSWLRVAALVVGIGAAVVLLVWARTAIENLYVVRHRRHCLHCFVLVFPLLAGWLVWREVRFGFRMQELAGRIEVVDERPLADRIDAAQAAPDDWRAWYWAGVGLLEAGDKKQARAALEHAWAVRDR